MRGAIHPLPPYIFMAWCSVKKGQGQFYIYLTLSFMKFAVLLSYWFWIHFVSNFIVKNVHFDVHSRSRFNKSPPPRGAPTFIFLFADVSNLILSRPSRIWVSWWNVCYAFLISTVRVTVRAAHHFFLCLINIIKSGELNKSWSSSVSRFLDPPVTSFLLDQNIFLRSMFCPWVHTLPWKNSSWVNFLSESCSDVVYFIDNKHRNKQRTVLRLREDARMKLGCKFLIRILISVNSASKCFFITFTFKIRYF
jgi:hypothetical protein